MVKKDQTKNECKVIDFAGPFDSRIDDTEKGYNDL